MRFSGHKVAKFYDRSNCFPNYFQLTNRHKRIQTENRYVIRLKNKFISQLHPLKQKKKKVKHESHSRYLFARAALQPLVQLPDGQRHQQIVVHEILVSTQDRTLTALAADEGLLLRQAQPRPRTRTALTRVRTWPVVHTPRAYLHRLLHLVQRILHSLMLLRSSNMLLQLEAIVELHRGQTVAVQAPVRTRAVVVLEVAAHYVAAWNVYARTGADGLFRYEKILALTREQQRGRK